MKPPCILISHTLHAPRSSGHPLLVERAGVRGNCRFLLAALCSLLLLNSSSPAATILWQAERFTGSSNNRPFTISMRSDPLAIGSNIVFGVPVTIQPTNSRATFSLLPGNYWIRIDQVPTQLYLPVPDSTNTYNAVDLVADGLKSLVLKTNYVIVGTNALDSYLKTNGNGSALTGLLPYASNIISGGPIISAALTGRTITNLTIKGAGFAFRVVTDDGGNEVDVLPDTGIGSIAGIILDSSSNPFDVPVQINGTGVTAKAFYGDGSHLTGISSLALAAGTNGIIVRTNGSLRTISNSGYFTGPVVVSNQFGVSGDAEFYSTASFQNTVGFAGNAQFNGQISPIGGFFGVLYGNGSGLSNVVATASSNATFASFVGSISSNQIPGSGVTNPIGAVAFPALTGDITTPGGSLATTLATVATPGTSTKVTYNAKGLVTSGSTADLSGSDVTGTLAAGRFPALTGDITTSAGALATTLKNTGTAGTYTKTTFDAQGRETSGTTLSSGDIPAIAESGVTGLVSDLAGKQAGPLTGDVTTSGAAATLATVATPGTSTKLTYNAKGLVTSGATADLSGSDVTGTLAAGRFPALTGDITTSAGALATTLKNTGTAGTYTKTTFDAQGRETSGTTLSSGDIPAIAESGVTGLVSDLAGKQAGPLTGDVTTSGAAATLATVATPGTSTKLTYNAKGLVTSGATATLASSDFANQGTATTVLHGNASGNPSFGAVALASDVSGTLADGSLSANVPLLNAANAWTGTSNYYTGNLTFKTNQNQIVPDFSIPEQLITTNAAFTFLAPVGVDLTKTEVQWTCVNVTNTTAAVIAVTPPANCHAIGTMNVTNWSMFIFQCYAQKVTNCFAIQSF